MGRNESLLGEHDDGGDGDDNVGNSGGGGGDGCGDTDAADGMVMMVVVR